MSMRPQEISPVPQETARVARAANPKGNVYMSMRDELGSIYQDQMFVALFARRGSKGFDLSHFEIDWQSQTVRCPTGQRSRAFPPTKDRFGQEVISVKFAPADCVLCPSREPCTQAQARSLTFRPQERYLALQSARQLQSTSDFKEAYAIRAGIESTISQAVRVTDLRQARSFGLPKTTLQHLITATAINVRRLVSWLIEPSLRPTQVSRLAALALKQSKPAA